jgi:hypothetical protein
MVRLPVSSAERVSGKGRPRSIPRCKNPKGVLDVQEEARLQVLRLLIEIENLRLKIDVAFGGEPFLPGLPPTCPANRRRFEVFLDEQIRASRLTHHLVALYLVTCLPKEEGPCSAPGNASESKNESESNMAG